MKTYFQGYILIKKDKIQSFIDYIIVQNKKDNIEEDLEAIEDYLNSRGFTSACLKIIKEGKEPKDYYYFTFNPDKEPDFGDLIINFHVKASEINIENFLAHFAKFADDGLIELVGRNGKMLGCRFRFKNGELYIYNNYCVQYLDDPDDTFSEELIRHMIKYISDKKEYRNLIIKELFFKKANTF